MKTLLILLFSMVMAGEMTVDGNLKVTGSVESATIDSLKAVIADLQNQLSALQSNGQWESRIFEFDFNSDIHSNTIITIEELIGIDLSMAKIDIVGLSDFILGETNFNENHNGIVIHFHNPLLWDGSGGYQFSGSIGFNIEELNDGTIYPFIDANGSLIITDEYHNIEISNYRYQDTSGLSFTVTFLVTAPFPNSNTLLLDDSVQSNNKKENK